MMITARHAPTHTLFVTHAAALGLACIPVMASQRLMTSVKLMIGYFRLHIMSYVFCCAGLVMPTGQMFAFCGIWLYLRYLVVVQFVMLLDEV